MKIHKIETGNFKLDGGALFGVIPKTLWNKAYPADENNLCNLSMRCMMIETGDRKILIDAGIGDKQSEKFFSYYYLNGSHSLDSSLQAVNIRFDVITDVILTHLHFDHCGGALRKNEAGNYNYTFPNATYWVSRKQWQWAMNPNQREKASYLKENFELLEESGKLRFIDEEGPFTQDIELRFYNGHSEGLIIPFIQYKDRMLVFMADLIPTTAHIPESWICGYDTQPLVSMKERKQFLTEAFQHQYILFFEHDINIECCTLQDTEKGLRMGKSFSFAEFQLDG